MFVNIYDICIYVYIYCRDPTLTCSTQVHKQIFLRGNNVFRYNDDDDVYLNKLQREVSQNLFFT
jgi:hypothetical protein